MSGSRLTTRFSPYNPRSSKFSAAEVSPLKRYLRELQTLTLKRSLQGDTLDEIEDEKLRERISRLEGLERAKNAKTIDEMHRLLYKYWKNKDCIIGMQYDNFNKTNDLLYGMDKLEVDR